MFAKYKDILTVADLCEMLHIGKNCAYALLAKKEIKARRTSKNGKYIIPKSSVIAYVKNNGKAS